MQGREWLYYLLDSAGKTYRIENGLVVAKNDIKPLKYTPDGWQEVNIAWERNLNKWGVNRNFSLPFGFVLDGADILKHLFYTGNIERQVYLLIQKEALFLDSNFFYYWYKFFYRGELDLSTFIEEEDQQKVSINIMEGGLSKDLNANIDTKYEVPVDELVVKMDGVALLSSTNFVTINESHGIAIPENFEYYWITIVFLNNDGAIINTQAGSTIPNTKRNSASDNDDNFFTDNWFFRATEDVTIRLTFSITVDIANAANHQIYIKNSNGTRITVGNFTPGSFVTPYSTTQTYNFDQDIALLGGEDLFLISKVAYIGTLGPNLINLHETTISIKYTSIYRTTYIRANTPNTVYKRLIEKITGSQDNGQSDLLNSKPNLAITSGDSIRGIDNSVIKSSLNDQFISYNVVLNAGIGIENNLIRLETKDYFFNDNDIIPLGLVKSLKIMEGRDFLYNTIKIGYPNQEYEDVNGRNEFNTTQIRSSAIKRVSKELDLVSRYRADMYGIEFTRINLEGKNTTDDGADNDTFIINIDYDNPQTLAEDTDGFPAGTIYYNLKRVAYDSTAGLISPSTAFNIEELTPKRLLEKHASYLNSIFYGFEGNKLVFQTIDKNPEVSTTKDGVTYDEDADQNINSSPRIFKPVIFEFEPETPNDLVELLQYYPNRCFSFIHPNGNTYKGYNLKLAIAANSLQEQVFQLISHPDNDLTTLK